MTSAEIQDSRWFFGEDGPAKASMPGYSPRPEQIAMSSAVEEALRGSRHLVVEAGTGVGKSLGYLVPSLLTLLPEGARIVVSTHTLSLQQQLMAVDLPMLAGLLPMPFQAELAKGRGNYLSPRRAETALELATTAGDASRAQEIRRVIETWNGTKDGTRQEIHPQPDPPVWEDLQSEQGNCLGRACSHYETDCSFYQARRRLREAQVLVVNHSLYMADLVLREIDKPLLPPHDVVIFDEAHTLESVAREHFGGRLTRFMVRRVLLRLARRGRHPGLLQLMARAEWARRLAEIALEATDAFFVSVGRRALACGGAFAIESPGDVEDGLSSPLMELSAALADLVALASSKEKRLELQACARRLDELAALVQQILHPKPDSGNMVHWVESGRRLERATLHMKPLEVSDLLAERLFGPMRSVILTSATLSVGRRDGLNHAARSLGCPGADKLIVGSPFNYHEHVRLRVPTWLDEPDRGEDYEERLANAILHYVERSQGGAFVLFTSYQSMRRTRDALASDFEERGFPFLVQGDAIDRGRMIEEFKKTENGVLFGTDSFWQGVDVPGRSLRLVIITRLPFAVPSDPLQKARAERIRARGGSPFKEMSLPEAVIRFKQGFGRLVRREDDRGTVVVMDTRILTKPYGRSFLDAIPPVTLYRD